MKYVLTVIVLLVSMSVYAADPPRPVGDEQKQLFNIAVKSQRIISISMAASSCGQRSDGWSSDLYNGLAIYFVGYHQNLSSKSKNKIELDSYYQDLYDWWKYAIAPDTNILTHCNLLYGNKDLEKADDMQRKLTNNYH